MDKFSIKRSQHKEKQLSDIDGYFGKQTLHMNPSYYQYKQKTQQRGSYVNLQQSQPSFCTEQQSREDDILEQKYLVSYPSQLLSSYSNNQLTEPHNNIDKKERNFNNKYCNKQKGSYCNKQGSSQYFPSLESYYSIDLDNNNTNSNLIKQKQLNPKFQYQNQLQSLSSVQLPSKQFIPDIRQLTQHIDFLQQQIFIIKKQYFKLKSFTQTVIQSLKSTQYQQVGTKLENYMLQNIINPSISSLINEQSNAQSLHLQSQLSQQFMQKLSEQSLFYSHQLQSQQLSDTIENIFTLAGQSNRIMKNLTNQSPSNQSCKSTQRKQKNFKKLKNHQQNIFSVKSNKQNMSNVKSNKQNTSNMNISQNSTSKKSKNHQSNKFFQKVQKSSSLIDHQNRLKSKKLNKNSKLNDSNKSLQLDEMTYLHKQPQSCKNSFIATQIMCEICSKCFQPNQFFKHLGKCKSYIDTQNSSIIQKGSRKGPKYTLLMENLFSMREQIEQQIGLLQKQRQKSQFMERNERQKLKEKLEQDLIKITRIIKAKQKQMQIHF